MVIWGGALSYERGTTVELHVISVPGPPNPKGHVQGYMYLARKRALPPETLHSDYAQGPRTIREGGGFLVSEVPLYICTRGVDRDKWIL